MSQLPQQNEYVSLEDGWRLKLPTPEPSLGLSAYKRAFTVDHFFTKDLADRLMQQSQRLSLQLSFWNVTSKYSTSSTEKLCLWPFERADLSSDLRIVPCCMIANRQVADLGDARAFTAQWNNAAYQNFRRAHLDGRVPKTCQRCYDWRSSTSQEKAAYVLPPRRAWTSIRVDW